MTYRAEKIKKEMKLICYISCIANVEYTRNYRLFETLDIAGVRMAAICPGRLSEQIVPNRLIHYSLPDIGFYFRYEAGFFNVLLAFLFRLLNSILLFWRLFFLKPDILICSEPDAWVIAVLFKKLYGRKIIVDLREVYDDRALAFPKFMRRFIRSNLKKLMHYLSLNTDEIIHVSKERQEVYSYLYKPGIIVGSFPRVEEFPLKNDNYMIESTNTLNVIHVGALRPSYASEQFLDAMTIIGETTFQMKFIVLGGVAGMDRKAKLINSLQEKGILEIVGQVPHSIVRQKLYHSDVGVSLVLPVDTAHQLAAPQKLFEYFAASLPVVVADVPTLRRIVTQHKCGLVVDGSKSDEIAEALIWLFKNSDERKLMGERGRKAAENFYNWEKNSKKLLNLVKSMIPD